MALMPVVSNAWRVNTVFEVEQNITQNFIYILLSPFFQLFRHDDEGTLTSNNCKQRFANSLLECNMQCKFTEACTYFKYHKGNKVCIPFWPLYPCIIFLFLFQSCLVCYSDYANPEFVWTTNYHQVNGWATYVNKNCKLVSSLCWIFGSLDLQIFGLGSFDLWTWIFRTFA